MSRCAGAFSAFGCFCNMQVTDFVFCLLSAMMLFLCAAIHRVHRNLGLLELVDRANSQSRHPQHQQQQQPQSQPQQPQQQRRRRRIRHCPASMVDRLAIKNLSGRIRQELQQHQQQQQQQQPAGVSAFASSGRLVLLPQLREHKQPQQPECAQLQHALGYALLSTTHATPTTPQRQHQQRQRQHRIEQFYGRELTHSYMYAPQTLAAFNTIPGPKP